VIVGIVLAAGEGLRIGQPKAWLRTNRPGECFFGRACSLLAAAGVDRIVGIIPAGGEAAGHRAAPAAILLVNPWPEKGQLSSLQLGLAAAGALELDAEAAVVLPVDVPLVTEATVRALLDRWHESHPPIVRPVNPAGQHGHPVLFSRTLFDALLSADPSDGAKPIVRGRASAAGDVVVDDPGAFLDIDTAGDYERAFHRVPGGSDA
jgi:CTP:molybdopterin cytidylyltransferase MocA